MTLLFVSLSGIPWLKDGFTLQVEQDIATYRVVAVLVHPGVLHHMVNIAPIFNVALGLTRVAISPPKIS